MGKFTEVDGGEAHYCCDDDQNIDIDVALSYIDERLQDVLGHYQKDFEGGVSAENLGAKFGGYGSFLPTYQHSPLMLSCQRTQQKVQSRNIFKPNNLLSEGAHQSSRVPSTGPRPTSITPPLPISRTSSVDSSVKFQASGESVPRHEKNLPNSKSDQNSLKVRIRVGSDSIMAQRNAAIYSGLGLITSPSSSLEDSPSECEGNFPGSQETWGESPSSIIKIMTSCPVPDGVLLSPLDDSFALLMEEEDLLENDIPHHVEESSSLSVNKFANISSNGGGFGENEIQLRGKSAKMIELEDESYEDPTHAINAHLKKEVDDETLTGNSLKLPHTSKRNGRFYGIKGGIVKASEAFQSVDSSNLGKEKASASIVEGSRTDKLNAKASLAEKVQKDKKGGHIITNGGGPKVDGRYNLFKENCDIPKGLKDFNGGVSDPPRKKLDQKAKPHQQDGIRIPHGQEQSASAGKKKFKGSQRNGILPAELPKESLRVITSAASEDMIAHGKSGSSKSNRVDTESQEDLMNVKESQGHSIGKAKQEKKEITMDSMGISVRERGKDTKLRVSMKKSSALSDKLKDTKLRVSMKESCAVSDKSKDPKVRVSLKETCAFNDKSKDRSGGKKSNCSLTFEAHQAVSKTSALAENGSISGALPAEAAPVVIEENWVCCDKCHKWRLLPYGTNPNLLPKKWLCSMLTWLPGMNRCSVSEDETTNALNALYQVPVPEVQTVQQLHAHGTASGVTLADSRQLGQSHQCQNFDALSSGGKKNHGKKVVSNAARHDSSMNLSNSSSDQPASTKRSLKDAGMSPLEFKTEERSGDAKPLKMKSKRKADLDGFRVSKKVKTKGMHSIDGYQSPGRLETDIDIQKYNEHSSSWDSKGIIKKPKNQVTAGVNMEDHNKRYIIGKKKQLMDWQGSQISLETIPSNGHQFENNWVGEKQSSGKEHGKGKMPRESELQQKESVTSIDGRPNRKGTVTRILLSSSRDNPADGNSSYEKGKNTQKDQPLPQYQRANLSRLNVDGKISSRRDLAIGQPPMAATSSSSKISSSCKVKVNSQEVKGSPVESVSSSPLRMFNTQNFRTNILGKDDAKSTDSSLMNNQRCCSEAEGNGETDEFRRARKEKAFSASHDRSIKSSLFEYQDRTTPHAIHGKVKSCADHPLKLPNAQLVNSSVDKYEQENQHPSELRAKEQCRDKERVNNLYSHSGSVPENFGRVSSSRAKENVLTSESGSDRDRIKAPDSHKQQKVLFPAKSVKFETETELNDCASHKEEIKDVKFIIEGNDGIKSDKAEKSCSGKKVFAGKQTSESSRREKLTQFGENEGLRGKSSSICQKDEESTAPQKLLLNHKVEKSMNWLSSDRTEQVEVSSGKKYSPNLPLVQDTQETRLRCSQPPVHGSKTSSGFILNGSSDGSDALKITKQHGESEGQNGPHAGPGHPTPNVHGARNIAAPSPFKQGTSIRAARNALKEAKNLKHLADRLKISGSGLESTELFFQAALKFLHGATLLELCSSEGISCGEMSSIEVFSSTARLCEYCAHEFERCKNMAFAALAYKCVEVAYMQVIYCTDSVASRDRKELQMALDMVPPDESPSSSASGVDNLNNQAAIDKTTGKDVSSEAIGNHVIAARNRPKFVRLLDFAQIVSSAMDASGKSQTAFEAANVVLAEAGNAEGISSVKKVLDFSFHDIDGLLRLVRLAMEALGS